ncbi:unnamed protein product [Caenorhabditis bovis]|uniref:Class II aldolase/adducin N-terminal domain-containing protein n=1 Tax=Caenorhabditis bovis TaxID=2654633 RepID=A0A8S1FCV4_9PELO|nr:unnamed protein product [Caenorhabditis bovis]
MIPQVIITMSERKERERPLLPDPDDPDYIKDLQRPAVIKEDLCEMERRKRVQEILESKSFCQELEDVIRQECDSSLSDPDHLITLQRLAELTINPKMFSITNLHAYGRIAGNPIPIADLRGNEGYSKLEKMERNKLACLFRLADLFHWAQGIYNMITYRIEDQHDDYLANPYGLLYHEITSSSLVKMDVEGVILDYGSSKTGINKPLFLLHSAIYKARKDAKCIIHMHSPVVSAVASMKCGLLPLCQEAMIIGPVSYHNYHINIAVIQNQGFVVIGETIEHAMFLAQNTAAACEIQVRASRAGIENLVIPSDEEVAKVYEESIFYPRNAKKTGEYGTEWNLGELEWESWMSVLDYANFKTGHIYKQPFLRLKSAEPSTSTPKSNSDVAVPPSASAFGKVDESCLQKLTAHKMALLRKEQERARWLNSPNTYQKVEVVEYGSDRPKKVTKWVSDGSSTSAGGTPIKISGAHQFSPASSNPKEFKEKRNTIKENSRLGTTSAGPKSQILDAVNEDISLVLKTDSGDQIGPSSVSDRAVFIGTGSKGIIDRNYQNHAQVYQQIYSPNPFSAETDSTLRKYFDEVTTKNLPIRKSTSSTPSNINFETYDEYEADNVSLMTGIREHKLSLNALSVSDDALDKEKPSTSTNGATTSRSFNVSATEHECTNKKKRNKRIENLMQFMRRMTSKRQSTQSARD